MIERTEETGKAFRTLREKLRSHRGTSLVETLMTILIMSILGGAITTGMLVSAREYTKSVRGMEKDMLFSTLQYVISYELQYSTSVIVDDDNRVIDVQAKTYGQEQYMDEGEEVDDIRRTFFADQSTGRIVYGIDGDYQPILSKNAYPKGMKASIEPLTYDPQTHYFHVVLSISYNNRTVVDSIGFDVLNLYGIEPKYAA